MSILQQILLFAGFVLFCLLTLIAGNAASYLLTYGNDRRAWLWLGLWILAAIISVLLAVYWRVL